MGTSHDPGETDSTVRPSTLTVLGGVLASLLPMAAAGFLWFVVAMSFAGLRQSSRAPLPLPWLTIEVWDGRLVIAGGAMLWTLASLLLLRRLHFGLSAVLLVFVVSVLMALCLTWLGLVAALLPWMS